MLFNFLDLKIFVSKIESISKRTIFVNNNLPFVLCVGERLSMIGLLTDKFIFVTSFRTFFVILLKHFFKDFNYFVDFFLELFNQSKIILIHIKIYCFLCRDIYHLWLQKKVKFKFFHSINELKIIWSFL